MSSCSVMLLFSRIGAITNVPDGTTTVPPPFAAAHVSIAFCTAAVSSVAPSPFAPNFFTSQTLPAAIAGTVIATVIVTIAATATSLIPFPFIALSRAHRAHRKSYPQLVIPRTSRFCLFSSAIPLRYTPNMRLPLILLAIALLPFPAIGQSQAAKAPTVAEAQAFMDKAETEMNSLGIEAARAAWMQETNITDDTEAIASKANERFALRTNQIVLEARRFDKLTLPSELARKFKLLKLNGTPTDPKLVAELTQTAAALDGMYGKGKYCPGNDQSKCLGIEEIGVLMAKSRDPQELLDLWTGWHAIAPPMRDKYARLVELSNQGANEFGFKDTGDLWRSGYDMTPAEFSAELETAWQQLQPLYQELHAYVRFKLIQKYGAAAERPDGMIPAHLLGNPWAQEWGNIYDIVQPTGPKTPAANGNQPGFKMYDLEGALKKQIAEQHPDAALAFADPKDPSDDASRAAALAAAKAMAAYGERFYKSIGFAPLPDTFWQRSQFIKPRDRDAVCHASAWDVDNIQDLRVKMCINVTADDFTTVHHEEGHLMYQRAYNQQPFMFRNGADDGFHEAIGDSIALAITPAYLKEIGLIDTIPAPPRPTSRSSSAPQWTKSPSCPSACSSTSGAGRSSPARSSPPTITRPGGLSASSTRASPRR